MMENVQSPDPPPPAAPSNLLVTRGYQAEMYSQSLQRNIIIALDTGAGKTHIAVLRLKHEMEKEVTKRSWFIAPTVALCVQQHSILKKYISLSIGIISGSNEPDQWKNAVLWQKFLRTHQIVVSTPQVLLDALRHGYIVMGRDISLIVFDEAHHAKDNNPYNRVMQEFYFELPPRQGTNSDGMVRPMILGLTASPIYGGNVERDLRTIERNLDCTICTPRRHRSELSHYVHRPTFIHAIYRPPDDPFSTNLASLQVVGQQLSIDDDPFVIEHRSKLAKSTPGSADYRKIDQGLSKVINKKDSFTHKGLRDFVNAATDICFDLGEWAADWFVFKFIEHARQAANPHSNIMVSWRQSEKAYLLQVLDKVALTPVSYYPDDIDQGCTNKVNVLLECLQTEMAEAQSLNEEYSCLIFVERRDTVLALVELLKNHPRLKNAGLNVGMLFGTSDSSRRHSMMDITRSLAKESQDDTLEAFRDGSLNLIVSTAVAEEGIDIQACCSVIRWDPPQNMKSWVQSRGRARKKRSTFTVMHLEGSKQQSGMAKWIEEERQMLQLIYDQSRIAEFREDDLAGGEEDDGELVFEIPSTGAKLTLHSAISHLTHFCAKIPNSTHVDNRPLFERDPPEFPDGWHSSKTHDLDVYQGLYGSTVTLPRALPLPQRQFSVKREYKTVISAHRHAAFIAYKELYAHGLLNENLLPIPNVIEPTSEDEVRAMLADVEKRESLANVTTGIDPWQPDDGETTTWLCSELIIEGLSPLFLFTRSETIPFGFDCGPVIHPPGQAPMRTSLHPLAKISADHPKVAQARDFTRRMFWGLNSSRMNWDDLHFAYLFLPVQEFNTTWDNRRAWLEGECKANAEFYPDRLIVKATQFVKKFGFVDDLTLIQRHVGFGRPWVFAGWRYEELTSEEEEKLRDRYGRLSDSIAITYPLMVVRPYASRNNMLLPTSENGEKGKCDGIPTQLLIQEHTTIILLSKEETEYSLLLPSVIRALSSLMTANSLRKTLFSSTPLQEIPLSLLKVAITAPSANDGVNYQRLETLGDAVLKFVVGVQLLAGYPLWHEGYLTKKKDHAVANVRLAKEDLKRKLYRWLIRDVMLGRKWKPRYLSSPNPKRGVSSAEVEPATRHDNGLSSSLAEGPAQSQNPKKRKSKGNQLSTKVLADVVESTIGAAYLHGGLPLGYECVKYFDLGVEWEPTSIRIEQILARADALSCEQASPSHPFPPQLRDVEHMLGYTFRRKVLLIEALTHASYQNDSYRTASYERMEFLGDSILDLIVNDFLYRVPGKNYSPGHIYLRKIAVVNMHLLAYLCLNTRMKKVAITPRPNPDTGIIEETDEEHEINLFSCLLHTSPRVLEDQFNAFSRYKKMRFEIGHALTKGERYPWAALTSLQAPKFFSDMIESLIGAVYLDSHGDMAIMQNVMREIGIIQVLEHIVVDDVDVLHPISRLSLWTQKTGKELEFRIARKDSDIICCVFIGGIELECARATSVYRGKVSEEEVKFAAAEAAIKDLKLRDVGVRYDTLKQKKSRSKKKKGKEKSEEMISLEDPT